MAHQLPRTDLSHSVLWCGEATLEAFGITVRGRRRTCWGRVLVQLRQHGYTTTQVINVWDQAEGTWPTLSRFIADHPDGNYVLFTTDHIMALRGGRLTDTELDAGGRRRIREAYRVDR